MPKTKTTERRADDARLEPRGTPAATESAPEDRRPEPPTAAVALRLAQALGAATGGVLHIEASEHRADEVGRALRFFAPEAEVLVLPPWDCLPFDRASPSRESMGRRMSALRALVQSKAEKRVLVTSLDAVLQRVPPAAVVEGAVFRIRQGEALDREALEDFAIRTGYVLDDRVDEPGEIAFRGEVVDVFPPAGSGPIRLMLDAEDTIREALSYDPVSQRTSDAVPDAVLEPASEIIFAGDRETWPERGGGIEHRLPLFYDALETIPGLLKGAQLSLSPAAQGRAAVTFEQIAEAHEAYRDFSQQSGTLPTPDRLYLTAAEWDETLDAMPRVSLNLDGVAPAPRFATGAGVARRLATYAVEAVEADARVLLTGTEQELRRVRRLLARQLSSGIDDIEGWGELLSREAGVYAAPVDLEAGFRSEADRLVAIAAADVLGTRIADQPTTGAAALLAEGELRVGDVVVHEEHGVGVLQALERIEVDGREQDTIRLEYQGGASVLAPVEEFGQIWRYGADRDAISLDRLNTDGWNKKRAEISAQVDADAKALVEAARQRMDAEAPKLVPPRARYERLAGRFPFPETPDQSAAIAAVLEDLASGRPMNRLVCGDVGFGKTEVALRAAAAAALSGKQVALVAPTTVLVRQHLQSFERRFAGSGIRIAQLSRLLTPAELREVKEGLASGEIAVVVATQAIAAEDVHFADLGLVIVDEEQRFGAKFKGKLQELSAGLHVLSMSATPIPRTLQGVLVGLQEVSVIATPPARRRPIRTFLAPFDGGSVRTALLRERRRGGQSFLVVPRIEDIEPMQAQLAKLVPELSVVVAHGELPPREVDEAMVAFAGGRGDILLATNIIESGLDVPQANTMLVWHADRFGLSQLHQLRGRVGRGRVQGVCYLLTDPEQEIAEATRARLSTLEAFDRLGSGLEISMRDLDQRGAGDLLGEEQAGHMKLIGVSLYQDLLARAVRTARGEPDPAGWRLETNLGISGAIPEDYVPEPTVRINLYSRLQRITSAKELDQFTEELEDRFGDLPEPVMTLIALTRITLAARNLRIQKLDAGPLAIAVSLRKPPTAAALKKIEKVAELQWTGERLVFARQTETRDERLAAVQLLLDKLPALLAPRIGTKRAARTKEPAPH